MLAQPKETPFYRLVLTLIIDVAENSNDRIFLEGITIAAGKIQLGRGELRSDL